MGSVLVNKSTLRRHTNADPVDFAAPVLAVLGVGLSEARVHARGALAGARKVARHVLDAATGD
jgi:hypothetical protein